MKNSSDDYYADRFLRNDGVGNFKKIEGFYTKNNHNERIGCYSWRFDRKTGDLDLFCEVSRVQPNESMVLRAKAFMLEN